MASHWFRISYAENAFKRVLAARELSLATLSPSEAVTAMIEFYEDYRAQHADLEVEGDLLELRTGTALLELRRTMTRDDGTQPPKTLSLAFTGADFTVTHVTRISSPAELELVRAHLREEPLVKAKLPVHLRME